MNQATIRFYAHLNRFLPPKDRQHAIDVAFQGEPSVKHLIEARGVPHTEVALIWVGDTSVDFSYKVKDHDKIAVYPEFHTLNIGPEENIRPPLTAEPRFVLDNHLGKLSTLLRMAGFDALYANHLTDSELAAISAGQNRILLTHDRSLLFHKQIVYACYIWSPVPEIQLAEVLERYHLEDQIRLFERCLRCNEPLLTIDKEVIQDRIPPKVLDSFTEFKTCPACGRIYWKGDHYDNMTKMIDRVRTHLLTRDHNRLLWA